MATDLYTLARTLLNAASAALSGTHGGTPSRRFVAMGIPVHDVPDQLTVHLPNVSQSAESIPDAGMFLFGLPFQIVITRPYPGQPGDSGVVEAGDLDEAAKILYSDADALLQHFICKLPVEAIIDSMVAIEPLGGVSGWTIQASIPVSA